MTDFQVEDRRDAGKVGRHDDRSLPDDQHYTDPPPLLAASSPVLNVRPCDLDRATHADGCRAARSEFVARVGLANRRPTPRLTNAVATKRGPTPSSS